MGLKSQQRLRLKKEEKRNANGEGGEDDEMYDKTLNLVLVSEVAKKREHKEV